MACIWLVDGLGVCPKTSGVGLALGAHPRLIELRLAHAESLEKGRPEVQKIQRGVQNIVIVFRGEEGRLTVQ